MFLIIVFFVLIIVLHSFFSFPLYFFRHLRLSSHFLSFVSLSYFILAVPMRECLGKYSCMSSRFNIAILNSTYFFPIVYLQVHILNSVRKSRNTDAIIILFFYKLILTIQQRVEMSAILKMKKAKSVTIL